MLISACSTFPGDSGDGSNDGTEPGESDDPANCIRFTGDHSTNIDTGGLATDALHLSGEAFICANDVVVVSEGDLNAIAAASQLAAAVSGPLLFPEPRLASELGRLKPERVHLIGSPQVNVPSSAETVEHDIASALALVTETLGATSEISVPAAPTASTIVEAVLAIHGGDRVAVPQTTGPGTTTATTEIDEDALVTGLIEASDSSSLWMVDASEPDTILLAAAVGKSLGASVVAFDADDILGYPQLAETLEGRSSDATRFVGGAPEGARWELAVLANGRQVPGGGFHILPEGQPRRYLAYYGHPGTDDLGVLGEQGPAETLEAMQGLIQDYSGDGAQVIPTFEMIASVASGGPTDDGDYSYEWPADKFQPWVDFARENDMYVVLDLQSGRDDFLSQAMLYEELLRLPFVGLALDPEWRLEPDQTHLNQIGSVTAAEVNETISWVADLVRDEGIPQKMIIVHQFRPSMIQNRQDIIDRPEVQVVIQMDGEGSEPLKDATWNRLLEGADDVHWEWGWKNFFDEDDPGPMPPENVMGKEPTPIYVSYQ